MSLRVWPWARCAAPRPLIKATNERHPGRLCENMKKCRVEWPRACEWPEAMSVLPLGGPKARRLAGRVSDAFFEPLPADELARWE